MNTFVNSFFSGFLILTLISFSAQAQKAEWLQRSPEERTSAEVKKLQEELSLSAQQLNEVEAVTAQKHRAINQVFRNDDEEMGARRAKLMKIWNKWDEEVQTTLDQDQLTKYAQLKSNYKEKFFAAIGRGKTHREKKLKTGTNSNRMDQRDADVMEDDVILSEEEEVQKEDNQEDALEEK